MYRKFAEEKFQPWHERKLIRLTASFRKLLGKSYTFDFIDGPFPCSAAAGIDLFYRPPYYSFYATPTIDDIRLGHQWLMDYMEENGPYDGVISFSQGGALVSSLLLYHQAETPHLPPPFKVAVFICCGAPLDCVEDVGIYVSPEAREWDHNSKAELMQKTSSDSILRLGTNRWGEQAFNPSVPHDISNVYGMNFNMMPDQLMIPIPTVHIYGAQDPRYPASITLAHFCDPLVQKAYDHGGGHDIPRKGEVSKKIAELIEWSAMMAN